MASKTTPKKPAAAGKTGKKTIRKAPPRDEAQEFHDRLVKLVALVAPDVRRLLEKSREIFPDGIDYWTEWPERVQNGLDLGDDGLGDLHAALSTFCNSDTSSALLRTADRVERGGSLLDDDDGSG